MSRRDAPIYRRGKYWLDHDRKRDGSLRTKNLYIWWYDPATRRARSASTGTPDVDQAVIALDRRYLADRNEAPSFCHSCGQAVAQAQAYLLTDAIADYRLEWASTRASAGTIDGRLKHVLDFLDAEQADQGRFGIETNCATACTGAFVTAFRAWSRDKPAEWRNKMGVVTVSRARSPSSTETIIATLIAVLNHAANADPPRSDKRPSFRPLSAKSVQRRRRARIGVPEIARMLAYAAEPNKRRESLHAFLVASLCTIARPGAVVDICVATEREQWSPGSATIDLNPHGRVQNKKVRPILPVLPLLDRWLSEEWNTFQALAPGERAGRGWLVNYHGRPVQSIDTAWATMLRELGMPEEREWRPYLLRHSLATLARNRGAESWDLQGYMGHRLPSQTEVYAIGDFTSVQRALTSILDELENLVPGALHRKCTGASD